MTDYTPHPGYQSPQRREERLAAVEAEAAELREIVRTHNETLDTMNDTSAHLARALDRLRDSNRSHDVRLWCLFGFNISTLIIVAVLVSKANIVW